MEYVVWPWFVLILEHRSHKPLGALSCPRLSLLAELCLGNNCFVADHNNFFQNGERLFIPGPGPVSWVGFHQ